MRQCDRYRLRRDLNRRAEALALAKSILVTAPITTAKHAMQISTIAYPMLPNATSKAAPITISTTTKKDLHLSLLHNLLATASDFVIIPIAEVIDAQCVEHL